MTPGGKEDMTTTTDASDARLSDAVKDLLDEIETLSADYGQVVQDAVALAKASRFEPAEAEGLYEMVARLLRGEADAVAEQDIAAEVRRLVTASAISSPAKDAPWGSVELVERNGLKPHQVKPVPTFNGKPVGVWEGYVDVATLDLWQGNHRVELQVAEFRERNHREPEPEELIQLVQGSLSLPSLDKKDPFGILPLAESIARKGVERPPILTDSGEPKDGNRRIAAAKYVLANPKSTLEQKENARWIKVWVAPPGTTDDQFDAIVVALNFEPDLKEPWPEFIKARMVCTAYWSERSGISGPVTAAREKALRDQIAKQFAIKPNAVLRYIRMVQWAQDFENYHVDEKGREAASVRYRADEIFQWFYEIQAGAIGEKITEQIQEDPELRQIVYDLMFDAMDAGTQVRSLYKIVADPEARQQLTRAHEFLEKDAKDDALQAVKEAVVTADRNNNKRKQLGFESFLVSIKDRLGAAPPDNWQTIDSDLLKDLERVMSASFGVIEGLLVARGERQAKA